MARLILMEALYPKYNSKANINGSSLSQIQTPRLILMEAVCIRDKEPPLILALGFVFEIKSFH
jgi:hypothetical protein